MAPTPEAAPHPSNAQAHASPDRARRACQARLRQTGEQNTAETRRSTPTVHATPHCGHEAVTPAFTASVRALVRRIRRQCLERQAASQNTAVDFADGINGPPHPRHSLGLPPSTATTTSRSRGTPSLPIPAPYERLPSKSGTGPITSPDPRVRRPERFRDTGQMAATDGSARQTPADRLAREVGLQGSRSRRHR